MSQVSVVKPPAATLGLWMEAMPHLMENLHSRNDNPEEFDTDLEELIFYMFPSHQSRHYNRQHLKEHAKVYKVYLDNLPRPFTNWLRRHEQDEELITLDHLKTLASFAYDNPEDYEETNLLALDPSKPKTVKPPAIPTNPKQALQALTQILQDAGFTVGPDPYNRLRFVVTDNESYRHTGNNLAETVAIAVRQLAILRRI